MVRFAHIQVHSVGPVVKEVLIVAVFDSPYQVPRNAVVGLHALDAALAVIPVLNPFDGAHKALESVKNVHRDEDADQHGEKVQHARREHKGKVDLSLFVHVIAQLQLESCFV